MSQSEARTANERKSGRFRLIVPCEIKGSKGSNMVPLRDISLDGCRVIGAESHAVGDALQLTLKLPHPVSIPAEAIAWRYVPPPTCFRLCYSLGCP